jgi:hypothetical protein
MAMSATFRRLLVSGLTIDRHLFAPQYEGQFLKKLLGRHLARLTKADPFDQVDPPLATQDVRNRGLAHLHFAGKFLLGQPGVGANSRHYLQYGFLVGGIDRLCHLRKMTNPANYRKSWQNIQFYDSRKIH